MLLNVLLDAASSDIWHDPLLLAIFGILATILAGGLSAVLALWVIPRLNKKEITYETISDTPVASINEKMENRVKILIDGNPINNAHLLVLKVRNSGRMAVKPEDYYEPMTFTFNGRTINTFDVQAGTRFQLQDIKLPNPNSLQLPKFFLNPGEEIEMTVLLSGPKGKVVGDAAIADGKIKGVANQQTEFSKRTDFSRRTDFSKQMGFSNKTVWDWLKLLGVLAIPLVVAIAWIGFTSLQLQTSELQHFSDIRIAQDQQQETTLKTYIDNIQDLILNHNLLKSKSTDGVAIIARERTITTLQMLDAGRNRIVLRFLQDVHLIGIQDAVINLSNVDLSGANLRGAILSNVDLSGANLRGAILSNADLSGANLRGAIFTQQQLDQVHSCKDATLPRGLICHQTLPPPG